MFNTKKNKNKNTRRFSKENFSEHQLNEQTLRQTFNMRFSLIHAYIFEVILILVTDLNLLRINSADIVHITMFS